MRIEANKFPTQTPFLGFLNYRELNKLKKERITKVLQGLGLSSLDAKVYIFLASMGPHKLRDVSLALNFDEKGIHSSLKELQSINIITPSIEKPLEFGAISFEELIDRFIEVRKEQAKNIQESKEELLYNWLTIMKKNSTK